MNKLKDIKTFDDLKEFLILNKDLIKKAALPLTVVAALLFFWVFGGDKKEQVVEEQTEQNPAVQEQEEEEKEAEENGDIYVDISGCVREPGVYQVAIGTRLFQVIEKAGGITEEADLSSVNRAEEVTDGQKIVIYPAGESGDFDAPSREEDSGKVNINRADSDRLQTVPGIGPATAQKIIEYREQNGRFKSIEDLKNVSGIGDKTLENMRQYITV